MGEEQAIINLIDIAIKCNGCHYDIAKVVKEVFKDKYKIDEKKNWYKYNNQNGWIKSNDIFYNIRNELSNEIYKKFMERSQYFNSIQYDDDIYKILYSSKSEISLKIALKLKDTDFKDKIMKECKYLFYSSDNMDI